MQHSTLPTGSLRIPRVNIAVLWLRKHDGSGWSIGGLERWCRDLARLLTSRGIDVSVYQKSLRPFDVVIDGNTRVIGVPAASGFSGNLTFSRWIRQHCDPAEPFIFVSQELYLTGRFRKTLGVNHGIWWGGDLPVWKRLLNKRLQLALIQKTDATICVDTNYINWAYAELQRRAEWENKLHYIPNYAEVDNVNVAGTPAVLKQMESVRRPGSLFLLFPRRIPESRIQRQGRGVELFLKAAKILAQRGIHFQLLFAGPCNARTEIEAFAARAGFASDVFFAEVEMGAMPVVYQACDIVVVPSLANEGTSLSAVEGLLSGKPTVVTHVGGLPNLVIDGLNGCISDLSPESLAEAILRAGESANDERSCIRRAMQRSLGKIRWERSVWHLVEQHL